MEPDDQSNKSAKTYGKMTRKQWIWTYIVLAIIVYAVIYFLFIRKSGSGASGGYGY